MTSLLRDRLSIQRSRAAAKALTIAASLVFAAAPASADEVIQAAASSSANQDDAGQRINLSGKLRMLSQRASAAACYAQQGVASDASAAMLAEAAGEFEQILAALEVGDETLGIYAAEERRKTIVGLGLLGERWEPMAAGIEKVSNAAATTEDIAAMAEQSEAVLEMAQQMVTEITGQYSNPAEIVQANAMLIGVAGRQRMLAQRMSKYVCLIAAGINVDVATEELRGAGEAFDASLTALRFGMASAGINPPPNDEIADGLNAVNGIWTDVQPIVNAALSGQTPNADQLAQMFDQSNRLTGKMNETVGLYAAAARQDN